MSNSTIFEYLEKSINQNSKALFLEKKNKYQLDKTFKIVEEFMIKHKLICYGGTALNNILPKEKQFYDYDYYSPDYDFFSPTAIEHVKELAAIFKKKGYKNILAKSAVHPGTFKLYVNYIQIADITQINIDLYDKLLKSTVIRDSIHYAPLQFLRMNLFLELSRPRGDISRWEKVMTRLIRLNESFPFTMSNCNELLTFEHQNNKVHTVFDFFHHYFISSHHDDIVFIGEYAIKQYSKYIPQSIGKSIKNKNKMPTFILVTKEAKKLSEHIQEAFKSKISTENHNLKLEKIKNIDDFLPTYYNIYVDDIHYATIFQAEGCQNYNIISRNKIEIKIGTLDTMLYYYFMFFYLDINDELKTHLQCYCFVLFYLQENYKVSNHSILQRFNLSCIGNQITIEDMIDLKSRKFKTLKNKRTSDEYKKYFLKYVPRHKKTKKNKSK